LQISILFACFTERELQPTPNSAIGPDVQVLYQMIDEYNRRFSGEPRSVCMKTEAKKYIYVFITMVGLIYKSESLHGLLDKYFSYKIPALHICVQEHIFVCDGDAGGDNVPFYYHHLRHCHHTTFSKT
jgi:hypothetical protein